MIGKAKGKAKRKAEPIKQEPRAKRKAEPIKQEPRASSSQKQQFSCNVSTKEVQSGQTAFMQMKATLAPEDPQGDILPRLDIQNRAAAPHPGLKASVDGLEADISLSKIRVETIHVVYRGLCDLSLLIKQTSGIGKYITPNVDNYKFKLFLAPPNNAINVDFTTLFTQTDIKRDDLSKLGELDKNMLITIGFLERLKKNTPPQPLIEKINEVLNNFIVCSSGKEYLDVGQLYAIIEPNTTANSSIVGGLWDEQRIVDRINNMTTNFELFIGGLDGLYPSRLQNIPKRPFYETHDSAAAPIAGKYYNTYTQATIPVSDRATLNLDTFTNPGPIPFLYDNNQVLYLCFLYNYCLKEENFNQNDAGWFTRENENGTKIFDYCKKIKLVKYRVASPDLAYCPVFDLLYGILINDLNNDIIKNFYESKDMQGYKDYKLINQLDYGLISSAYYFFMEQNRLSNKQNLITANLDSLCHDNKDSPIYRYLMMYNLIKKNNNQNDDLSNPLLKELLETFRPIPQAVAVPPYTPLQYLPALPSRLDRDDVINDALNNLLISNFTPLEKQMFGLLATKGWSETEDKLINRMICNNCYVFPVTQTSVDSETNKLILISMDEALGLAQGPVPLESEGIRRAAYASFYSLFSRPQRSVINSNITKIQVKSIIPYFSRCCCDLAISDNLSLTKVDVPGNSFETSIFNITPVTLNDAASAALQPSAIYLPDPVIIPFGDKVQPNNYNYNLVFWGYNQSGWNDYKSKIPSLKYFFNLQAFETEYERALTILGSISAQIAPQFNRFRYILQDFASASYSTKKELYDRIVCFDYIYDPIITRFIHDDTFNKPRHIDCLKPFCEELDIDTDACTYKTLYDKENSTFAKNLKKTIEKLENNMNSFSTNYQNNPNSAKKNAAYSNPPVFKNLVDGVMELITHIDDILRKQDGIIENKILECEGIIIGEWLIPFITNLAGPFIGAVPHCPEMRGGNGKDDQNKTTNIPITSFIGKYGFYQVPDDDGGLTFKPINTLEEQKQVWEMLGIHVNPVPSSNLIDNTGKGIDTKSDNLTQIRKEGIIRNLMKTKGLSLEQATAEVNKPYTLPQGKDNVIPPAPNIPKLNEGPAIGNSGIVAGGTKRAKTGGKYTRKTIKNKKHKNKTNKKRLIRKKNKRIIRRTRRKH